MPMGTRKITINDVAERAQVSKSVVSIVLSGRTGTTRVSEKTRRHVLSVAQAIHYKPNLIARSLHEHKSFLLAYLCTGGGSWGLSTRMLRSIQNACRKAGYSLVVYPCESLEEERINLRAALDRQVDGIIATPFMNGNVTNAAEYEKIAGDGMPVVLLGTICSGLPGVTRDCGEIGRMATEQLLKAGRRKIFFLTYENYDDPLAGPSSHAEYLSYAGVMRNAGLKERVIAIHLGIMGNGNTSSYKASALETSYAQAEGILKSYDWPDALLASSNSLAYGVGLYCRDHGKRIPEDIAILSCSDDYILPSLIFPRLSCYPLEAAEIGRKAVEMCLNPGERKIFHIRQNYRELDSFHEQSTRKQGGFQYAVS